MIVDSSALLAILLNEPDAAVFARRLQDSTGARMSAGTAVEAGIVALKRVHNADPTALPRLIAAAAIRIEPVDTVQVEIAWEAYRRYGRGIGEPACLNFGDCFSYALAKARNEPLLYKGDDFARTDLRSALQ